jgi:hypothetical protein
VKKGWVEQAAVATQINQDQARDADGARNSQRRGFASDSVKEGATRETIEDSDGLFHIFMT